MIFLLGCFVCVAIASVSSQNVLTSRRVIDGYQAQSGQFPYVAQFYYGPTPWCTATIIHERWALTAAHCIDYNRPDPKLLIGSVDSVRDPSGLFYNAENTLRHEAFTYIQGDQNRIVSVANDIGLIRVNTPIAFSANVQPIPLATNVGNYANQIATVVGFGKSNVNNPYQNTELRYGNLRVISDDECRQYFTFVTDSWICAAVMGTQSTCAGDSGGPLIANGIQMGVSSATAAGCGPNSYPNLFTKVSSFKPWIQQQLSVYGDVLPY